MRAVELTDTNCPRGLTIQHSRVLGVVRRDSETKEKKKVLKVISLFGCETLEIVEQKEIEEVIKGIILAAIERWSHLTPYRTQK